MTYYDFDNILCFVKSSFLQYLSNISLSRTIASFFIGWVVYLWYIDNIGVSERFDIVLLVSYAFGALVARLTVEVISLLMECFITSIYSLDRLPKRVQPIVFHWVASVIYLKIVINNNVADGGVIFYEDTLDLIYRLIKSQIITVIVSCVGYVFLYAIRYGFAIFDAGSARFRNPSNNKY